MTTRPSPTTARQLALGVLMGGFEGTTVPDWLFQEADAGLASVCLFSQNTPDVGTARRVTEQLRHRSPNVVVCIDEEGGDVTRLQTSQGSGLPGNAALGHLDDPDVTRSCGSALGSLCAAAGIDVALGPVLDVVSERCSSVVSTRSFGCDPALVSRQASAWLDGLASSGTRSCAKHFPGHGATAVDSHSALPVISAGAKTVRERDMAPFLALSDRLDAIMTAHIVVPELGTEPASLSLWARDALRDHGFEGVIMTDALGMRAITNTRSLGAASVASLAAGADLICLDAPHEREPRAALLEAVDAIAGAVLDGTLDPDKLEASAARTRLLKRTEITTDAVAAEAELDRVGLSAARAALSITGNCSVTTAVAVVDLRVRGSLAVSHSTAFLTTLLKLLPHSRVAAHPADIRRAETPLIVTRMGGCHEDEDAALQGILAVHPEAIVLHAGTASTAPGHSRELICHGTGRANAQAAGEWLCR